MWGTATSSFQIEGSNDIDGKIESIWDEFCDRPNTIKNSDNAKIACDHYNRFNQDFNLLDELGVNSYRFSISWPRIVRDDLKRKNQKGLDFYSRMIDTINNTIERYDFTQDVEELKERLRSDIDRFI